MLLRAIPFALALTSLQPAHAAYLAPTGIAPAMSATALADPELARIVGGAAVRETQFGLVVDDISIRQLALQARIGDEIMGNWWASEGSTILLLASALR